MAVVSSLLRTGAGQQGSEEVVNIINYSKSIFTKQMCFNAIRAGWLDY
jgi:hypothetical protein